jgi:hypothetical protein
MPPRTACPRPRRPRWTRSSGCCSRTHGRWSRGRIASTMPVTPVSLSTPEAKAATRLAAARGSPRSSSASRASATTSSSLPLRTPRAPRAPPTPTAARGEPSASSPAGSPTSTHSGAHA